MKIVIAARQRAAVVGRAGLVGICLSLAVSPALADPKPDIAELNLAPIKVDAQPLPGFERFQTSKTRFGKLVWRGGLVLTSPSPFFGGWSGLALNPDGKRFIAVSDSGIFMRGSIDYDGQSPKGLSDIKIGPQLARDGTTLARDRDRDSEAIALVSGTVDDGKAYIAFEQNHRIGRFDLDAKGISPIRERLKLPKRAKDMRRNRGFEAMTVLRGGKRKGAVVAMSERLYDVEGRHTGWIWERGEAKAFNLTDIGNYDITDVAGLPNGDLLVLERRFRWLEGVKSRVRRIAAADLKPGAVLTGEVILDADLNQQIDNFEAMATHTGADGATVLTLVSDNNFNNSLQRTLLVQFTLDGANEKSAAGK